VINAKLLPLASEAVTTIKTLMAKIYGPLVVVQAFPLLAPSATAPSN
jgi:hypothetical protein